MSGPAVHPRNGNRCGQQQFVPAKSRPGRKELGMNCINHPEVPAVAYCQQCGKALCSQCVRTVSGIVLCEPCLAAKLGMPGAGAPASGNYTVNIGDPNFQYSATGPLPAAPSNFDAKPVLAGILGFIPGVGAMYNGQFIKGLVHVLVFVIL